MSTPAAPATTTVVEQPPAASSAAPATIPEQPAPKRTLTEKLLGRTHGHDVEKLSPAEEDADTKKKRRRAAAGILGSLCGLLTALTFLSLFGLGMVSVLVTEIPSFADHFVAPVLPQCLHHADAHLQDAWLQ